jgi:hypothetical protein
MTDLQFTIGTQPTLVLRATNSTGAAATLSGWIDYNNNGVLLSPVENGGVFCTKGAIIAHFVIGGIGGAVMGLVFHQPDSDDASNTPASPEVRRRRIRARMKRDAHLTE